MYKILDIRFKEMYLLKVLDKWNILSLYQIVLFIHLYSWHIKK